MTNITYFYDAIREYYTSSSASSSFSEHQTSPRHHSSHGGAAEVKVETAESPQYTTTVSSSFSGGQTPQHHRAPELEVEEASTLGSLISKVYSACARPPVQLEQEEDDNLTTSFIQKGSGQEFSPKFGSSTSRRRSTLRRFDFAKLKAATGNFQRTSALKCSLGSVFEAWVDGRKLASEKLGRGCITVCVKVFSQERFQGHTEFLERVNYLAHVEHPNLVRLLGYGLEERRRLLVYEFISQGSLEDHLFGSSAFFPEFYWSMRMKVALDAAKGLAFLHSFEIKLIHGCFKPSNIFVDWHYNAKLSCFGVTKDHPTIFPDEVMDSVTSQKLAYSINSSTIHDAPEYRYTGQFSAKSDVYSFGVVFLEMLCGRRAFEDSLPLEEQNLVEWTDSHSSHKCRIFHFLDSNMRQYSKKTIQKAVKLAVKCLSIQVNLRPTMDEVVQELEELQN